MAVILYKMEKDKGLIEERFDSADINIATHENMGWCVSPERAKEIYEANKPKEPEIINQFEPVQIIKKGKPGRKPTLIKVTNNAGQSEI